MNTLQSPGSGLPPLEQSLLQIGLKLSSAFKSDHGALQFFHQEAYAIIELVDNVDYDFASQRVLVPRFRGMEDSSRNWSLFMVLDHLCRVNREILRTIDVLHDGIEPRGEFDISWFKPDHDCGADSIDEFRDIVLEFQRLIEGKAPLRRGHPKFPHPWFGILDSHQWLCLAGFHHRIHRKQARKIAAMLGQA